MKVLIIENERPAAKKLERLLGEINGDIQIAGILESVEETINWWLSNPSPDLLLMDIQLDDGLCFEIFEKVKISTPVIFITAYDEYALKAFRVNSIDYLLKPLSRDDLSVAIDKYEALFRTVDFPLKIEGLINQLQPATKERFLIKAGEHFKSIQTTDIYCFFIRERCNFILTREGREYAIDYSLDKIEKIVNPGKFFRINRNFIINYAAILDVIVYSSNRLKVSLAKWADQTSLLVSRERVIDFKRWMDR
jgi:DNA-binding LytR/AlgR family response regulator